MTDANDQYFLLEYTFSSCDDLGTGVYTLRYNGTSITDVAKNVLVFPSEGFVLEDKITPRILYAESFDTNEDQVVDKVEIRLSESIKDTVNGVPIDASDFSLEETFSGITVTDTFDTFSTATEKIQSTDTINDQYFSLSFTTPTQLNSTGVFTFIHDGSIQDIEDNAARLTISDDGEPIIDGIPPGIRNALTLDTDDDGRIDKVEIELTENIDDSRISADSFSLTPPMEFGTTDTLSNFSTIVTKITSNTAADDQYYSLTFTPDNSKGTGIDTLRYFGSSLTDDAGNTLLLPDGYILPKDSAFPIILNSLTLDEDGDGNVEKVEIELSESINDSLIQTEVDNNRSILIPPLGYGSRDTLSDFSTIVTEIATDIAANNQYFSLTFTPTHAMGTGIYRIRFLGISVSTDDGAPPKIIQAKTFKETTSRINVEIQLSESVHDTSISNHLSDFTLAHPTGYCQTGNFTGFSKKAGNITNDTTANDQYFSLEYTPCDSFSTGVYILHYNGISITDSTNNALVFPSEGVVLEDKIPPRILYAESFDTNEDQVVDKVEIRLTEPIKDSINGVPIDASNFLLEETFSGETIADTFDTFSTATAKIQITNTINDQYFSLDFTTPPQLNSTGVFMFMHNGNIQDIQNNVSSLTGGGRRITDGIPPGIRNALTLDTDGDGRVDKVEIELTEYIDNSKILPSEFSLTPPMEFGTTDTLSNFSTIVTKITSNTGANDQYFSLTFNPINSKGTGVDTLKYFGTSLTDAAGNTLLVRDGYVPEDSAMLTIFNATTLDGDEDGNVDTVEIEASEFIDDNRIQTEVSQGRFTLTPPMGFGRADILSNFNTEVTGIAIDTGANDQYFSLSFNPTNVMGTGVDTLKYTGTTLLLPKTGRILTDGAPPIILRSVTLDTNRDGSVETVEIALSENINDANISPNEFSLTSPMEFGTTDVLFGFSTEVNRIVDDTDANDQYYSLTFDPVNSGGTGVDTLKYFGSSLTDAAGNTLLLPDGYFLPEDRAFPMILNALTLDEDGDGNVEKVEIKMSEPITDTVLTDVFALTPPSGYGNTDTFSIFSTIVTVIANDTDANDQYYSLTFDSTNARNSRGTGIYTLSAGGNILSTDDRALPIILRSVTLDTNRDGSVETVEIALSENINDANISPNEFSLTSPMEFGTTDTLSNFSTIVTKITSNTDANDQYYSLTFDPINSGGTGVDTLRYFGTSLTDAAGNTLLLPDGYILPKDSAFPIILNSLTLDEDGDGNVEKVEIETSEFIDDDDISNEVNRNRFKLMPPSGYSIGAEILSIFNTEVTGIAIDTGANDQYFSLSFDPTNVMGTGVDTLIYEGTILPDTGRVLTDGAPPIILRSVTLDMDGDGRIDKVEIELSENINDTNISADSFSLTPPLEFGTTDTLSNPPPDNSPIFNTEVSVIANNTDDINDQYFSLIFTPRNSKGTGVDTLRYFGTSLTDAAGNILLFPNGYVLPEDSAMLTIFNATTLDEDGDGNVEKVEIEMSEPIIDTVLTDVFALTPPSGYGNTDTFSIFSTIVTVIVNDTDANDQYYSLTFDSTNARNSRGTGIYTLSAGGNMLSTDDRALPIILRSVTLDMEEDGSVDKVEIELSEYIDNSKILPSEFSLTPSIEFGTADILSTFESAVDTITNDTDDNDQYFSLIFNPTNSRGTGVDTLKYFGSSLVDSTGNALLPFVEISEDKALPVIVDKTTDLFPGDDATDIGVISKLRMIFSERVRWDTSRAITFVENTVPPTSTIILQQNQNNPYDTLVTITIPETTTNTATNYYTVIEDGAFIDESNNISLDQNFTADTAWNFRTRQGLYIRSIDVNSNKDMVLEFNDDVEILDLDSSDFILSNSLDTFRITGVFQNNSQPNQVRIVINEADTASVFGDLVLSFDGVVGNDTTTKINSDAFGTLEDFADRMIDFDRDNPTLDILTFNEDTIHLTFSERVQIDTGSVSDFTITDGKGVDYPNIVMNIIDEVVNDNKLSLKLNASLNSLLGDLTFNYNSGILRIRDFGSNQLLNFNEVLDIDTSSPTIKNIFMVSGGVGIEDTLVLDTLMLVFSEDVSLSSNDFTVFSLSDEKNISHIITSLIDDVSSTNDTLLLTVRDLSNVTTNLILSYSGSLITDYGGNNLERFSNQSILSVFKDNTPLFYCRDLPPFFLNINDIPLGIDTKDNTSVDPPEDDVEKDDFYKIEIYYKKNNVIYTEIGKRGIFKPEGEISVIRSNDTLLSYTGNSMAGTPSRAGESWRLNLAALNNFSPSNKMSIDTLLLVYIVSKDDGSAPKALANKEIYILPERPSLTTDILGKGSLIQSSGDYELKFCDGEEVPGFVADNSSDLDDLITWFDDNGHRITPTNNNTTYLSDIFTRTINSVVNYDNRSFYNFSFSKLSVLIEDSIQGGCPSRKVNISVNPPTHDPPTFDSLIINAPTYQHPNLNSLCETDISTDNDSLKLRITPGIRNSIYDSLLIVNSFKVYSGAIEERVLISTQEATQEEFFLFDYSGSSTDRDGNVIRSIDTVFHITQMSDSTEYFDGCESNPLTVNIVIHPQPDLPITEGHDTENEYVFCNVGVLQSSSISIKEPDTSYQYVWYRDEGLTDILLSNNSSIGMDVLIRANVVDIDNFTTDSIYVVASSKGCDSEKQLVTIKNNPNDLGIEFADDRTGAINGTEFCLSSDSAIIKGVLEGKKVAGEFSIDTFGMVSRSNPILTHTLGTTLDTLAMFNSEDSTLTINFLGLHRAKQNSLSMVGGSTSIIPITFTYSDADGCANTYTSTITIHPLPAIDFIAEKSIDRSEIDFNFTSDSRLPKGEVCYDAFFYVTFSGELIDAAGGILPINTGLKFYLNDSLEEEEGTYRFDISDNISSANISEEDTIRLEYIHPIQSNSMESDDGCMNTITKVLQVNALPSIEFSFDFDSNDSTDNSFCFTKTSIVDEAIKVRKDTLHITAISSTITTTGDTISVPSDSFSWSLSDLTQGFMDKQNRIVDLFPEILHTAALSNSLEGGSSSEISANFTITDEKGCMGTNSAPVRIHPLPEISFGILRGTDASTIIQSNNELDNLSATICYTEESLIFRGVELAYNDITDETDTLDAIVTDIGFTVNNQPIALQNGQFLFRMSDEYNERGETLRYVEDLHSRDTLNILFTYTQPNTGCINTIKKTLYIAPLPNVTDILPIQVCKGNDAILKIEVENLDRVDSIEWSHESSISSEKSTKRKGKGDNNSTTVTALYETGTALPSNNSDNLIVTAEVYESGCPFSFSKTILIGEFPDPKVSWLGITEGLPTDFKLIENNSNLLNNDIDSIYYSVFEENRSVLIEKSIGKEELDTTRTQENNILYPFSNTFFVSGNYGIDVYMRSDKGCDSIINRDFTILSHKEIGVEGYSERFEDEEGGWLVETRGNDNPIFNNDVVSWELSDTISLDGDGEVNNYGNSSQFWITGVNKPYEEGEMSYVYSPSFDFTESFEKLTVSFDIYFRFESVRDGVVFQYSTSNGLDWITLGTDETGLNWYNARNIASVPGDTRIGGSENDNFNSTEVGWTDKMLDDSKWLNASVAIPLEDRSSVRFRFALDAQRGSKSESTIGFAFDNFRISEREKTVLIEHFMSVNNADAKNNHDRLDSLYKNDNAFNTIDIIWINYFMNFTDREDLSARTSNYAINEIPEIIIAGETREDAHLLIDGSFDEIFLNDAENELLGTSGFSIDGPFVEFNEDTDMLTISINVISASSSVTNNDSELGIYFVVIEPEVILDTAVGMYEAGDTIKNVVRKILPNGAGNYQQGEWVDGDTRAFTDKWRVSNLSADSSKLQVVAFIQNFDETKNVHQAKISDTITVSRTDVTGIDNYFSDVTILYPNPISNHHFVLEFSRPTLTDLLWRMYDQTGKSIKNGWIPNSVSHHQISIKDLSDGMYFIMIKNEAEQKTTIKRFLVRKEE